MKNNLREEIKKKLQSLFHEFKLHELLYWESSIGSHLVKIKPSSTLNQDDYIEREISIFDAINEMYPHTELAFLPWESPIYPDGAALLSLQHKCFDVPILPQFKDLPGEKLTEIQTKTIQHNLSNIALPVHFFDIIPTTEAYIESNFYISSDTSSLNYVAAKEQFFSAA